MDIADKQSNFLCVLLKFLYLTFQIVVLVFIVYTWLKNWSPSLVFLVYGIGNAINVILCHINGNHMQKLTKKSEHLGNYIKKIQCNLSDLFNKIFDCKDFFVFHTLPS